MEVNVWSDLIQILEETQRSYILKNVVEPVWVNLNVKDKQLIADGISTVVGLLMIRYNFNLWPQLTQNDNQDLLAIMVILLPFIKDDDKRKHVKQLSELYLAQDTDGQFIYTNSQYNRCRRLSDDSVQFRPYLHEYFYHHLHLLLASINQCANKLYVNWSDVIPVTMTEYPNSNLFKQTHAKITTQAIPNLISYYHDLTPGLTWQDIYDVISNNLFQGLKKYRWIMYDVDGTKTYLEYLESVLDLTPIWKEKTYDQLEFSQAARFKTEWQSLLKTTNKDLTIILSKLLIFMALYHTNAEELGLPKVIDRDDEDVGTVEQRASDIRKLAALPIEEIYDFLHDQLTEFKKTWFYYATKVNKKKYPSKYIPELGLTITVTPKSYYNLAKSLTSGLFDYKFKPFPNHWQSLGTELVVAFISRILDLPHPRIDWSSNKNWYVRNAYFRRVYPGISNESLPILNRELFLLTRQHLTSVIFESMILAGTLSRFVPMPSITNDSIVGRGIAPNNLNSQKQKAIHKAWFQTKNFDNHAYYWLTGTTYSELTVDGKRWFDQIGSSQYQDWILTYAMNWISQINFFHHFINCRVIYLTGSTGVGKSTQVPKLAMYAKYMLQYVKPKVICTQPRIDPTYLNSKFVSTQLGVPIVDADKPTSNYYVQYEYESDSHSKNLLSYLRFVTDGKLYSKIRESPFVTKLDRSNQPTNFMYSSKADNIYDVIIVDEAHEHNTNMDLILTLARDAVYVNNNLTLIIVSATMDDDEPIYRRYYRTINDNRAYPLSKYIEINGLDRANIDRRVHINPPGKTTRHKIITHYLNKSEADLITPQNYAQIGILKTLSVVETTTKGDVLLFLAKVSDVTKAVQEINSKTSPNVLALPFYGEMTDAQKDIVRKIHLVLRTLTRTKDDVITQNKLERVQPGTYTRAVIVATNIAEASISLPNLEYVIDTGFVNTVVFDPINNISAAKVVRISNTSSEQRKGRVGRVRPGTVYFLYDKDKVAKNKTTYNIAISDIKYTILGLTQSTPYDSPIINHTNDVNNLNIIDEIRRRADVKDITEFIDNPMPYLDIIWSQYASVPLKQANVIYKYYGKDEDSADYWSGHHDDYDYQRESVRFQSTGYTGYRSRQLIDRHAQFYIIHPDENAFKRNMFTGKISALQCSDLVEDSYYAALFRENDIYNASCEKHPTIDFDNFFFLKVFMAYVYLTANMLTVGFQNDEYQHIVEYPKIPKNWQKSIRKYFSQYNDRVFLYHKSTLYGKLEELYDVLSYKNVTNYDDLLWYAYGTMYGVQDTIMALIIMLDSSPTISKWFVNNPKTNQSILAQKNSKSDIYFLYEVWKRIEPLLPKSKLLTATQFEELKRRYLASQYIPQKQLFDRLQLKGRITYKDYIKASKETLRLDDSTKQKITSIAKVLGLDDKLLVRTIDRIVRINHTIQSNLTADPVDLKWIKTHLDMPIIFVNPTEWDIILQQYIRAYASNLVFSYYDSYMGVLSGLPIGISPWTRKFEEKTLLNTKPPYLIYHKYDASTNTIQFLTPVSLEWYAKLNPILNGDTPLSIFRESQPDEALTREYVRMFNNDNNLNFLEKLTGKRANVSIQW